MPEVRIPVRVTGAAKGETAFKKLGSSMMGAVAAYASFAVIGYKVFDLLEKSVKLYGVQELAEAKLRTAYGKSITSLTQYASALQKQTTFGDEAIIEAEAKIAAFVKDEKQVKSLTKATLDLATASGMDLRSAADLVAKSVGSTTNALKRYGIDVEGVVGSTERADTATRNIAKLFGGQASAAAQTFAGSLIQISNAQGDLLEEVGELVSKGGKQTGIFKLWGDVVSYYTLQLQIANFNLDYMISKHETLEEKLKNTSDALKRTEAEKAAKDLIDQAEAADLAAEAWKKLNEQIMAAGMADLDIADMPIKKQIDRIIKELPKLEQGLVDIPKKPTQEFEKFASGVAVNFDGIANRMIGNFDFAFSETLVRGENLFTSLGEGFKQMLEQMVADFLARAFIFGIFSMFGGGGLLGAGKGFLNFATGGLLSNQFGMDATVGGSGAPDSKIFASRVSPGERIQITPEGESQTSGITVNINARVIDQKTIAEVDRMLMRHRRLH